MSSRAKVNRLSFPSLHHTNRLLSFAGGDYDPSHVVLGIELLEELLPRMPRLHNLTMSVPPFQPLLSPDYLQTFPFLSLEHLSLILKETSPPLPPNGLATLRHLEGIPSLGALALRFERRGEDAVSCLNVEPSTYLPPRSVKVKTIFLDGKVVGDVSTLFAALGSGCLSLTLCVAKLSPSIERDFLLLPGSLGSLTVKQGENCGLHPPPPFLPSRPRIGRALANLVNLSYLELQGDVLSPEGFDALPHLPLLHQLVLDPHLRLSSRHLLAFLDADNPLHLAYLGHLNVSVCLCGSAPSGSPKLTWPPSFSAHDARLLVEKANEIGMDIRGSLVWAVCHPLPKPKPKNGVVGRKLLRKAR